jgi:hypothetical protein
VTWNTLSIARITYSDGPMRSEHPRHFLTYILEIQEQITRAITWYSERVFWDKTPFSPMKVNRHFGRTYFSENWPKNNSSFRHIHVALLHDWQSLWSIGQSSWLQIQRFGLDSRRYHIFWELVALERRPLSLVSTIEELFRIKSSGFSLEIQEYGRRKSAQATEFRFLV